MAQRPSYASIAHRESFCHERLKLAENSIRLFQVQGGDKNEPISLRITQYSSARRPPYKAVSYTWGSAADCRQILVNGRAFLIHYNLWIFLYHMRLKKETSFLWADALCIDQANLRERNFHVQLMGKIYDQAKSVVVWLGLSSPDRTETRAMDFIRDVALFRKAHGDTVLAKTYMSADVRHRWETLLRACDHIYWTRTWIIQEFLRAPEVEVICGTASINWNEFEDLLTTIQRPPFNQYDVVLQILATRPARLTLRRRALTTSTLHELLTEYHDSSCTEPRDKVYGIMGLASDCGEDEATGQTRGMTPDYTKHIIEVYLDAVACIQQTLISPVLLPSVANLVRHTLLLEDSDFMHYINSAQSSLPNSLPLTIVPEYVGRVDATIPSWTSISDLKSKLVSVDWGQFLGYEIRPRDIGARRRASFRGTHAALPDDMLANLINVAEFEQEVLYLHNYPSMPHLIIPPQHLAQHVEDKRLYDNPDLNKPCIIIEDNRAVDTLRLGFACTNARRGDLIFQFRGLDTTLICREIGNDIFLVGKAMMVKHCQLQHHFTLDAVCIESQWLSPCLCSHNPSGLELNTDALSLAEFFTKR